MEWLEVFIPFVGPISMIINLVVVWVIWSLRQTFARKEDLNNVMNTVVDLQRSMHHLPTARETHELALQMETIKGEMKTMEAKMSGLGRSIDRVERPLNMLFEHELKGGNK